MIKVGQFLSSRVDILPQEIVDELSGLQDEVPPEAIKEIIKFAESELGASLENFYDNFNPLPLASASLGQVHTATLKDCNRQDCTFSEVVVKIQRPNIESLIKTDLAAISRVGGWLYRYPPIKKRANIPELVREFSKILYEEIDYISEGNNAEKFAENFKTNPGIRVPQVVWSLTRKRILTLENVIGIKITDYASITNAGIPPGEVADRLLDTYLKQIFEDGFFHADPHPGNLFVTPSHASNDGQSSTWILTFVDFGMTGKIDPNLRHGLRELIIGIGLRDSKKVVNSYMILGVLLPSADLRMLEDASHQLFEQFWGRNMKELQTTSPDEIIEFLNEYRELLYSLPFQIPTNIIFLARTIGILSGICTGLNPEFNAWNHIAPYAQKIISDEKGMIPKTILNEVQKNLTLLLTLPAKLGDSLDKLNKGEIEIRIHEVNINIRKLGKALVSISGAIIFMASLLAGIQLLIHGYQNFSYLMIGFAMLWLVFAYNSIRKTN